MTADEIKTLYVEKLLAYEKAQGEYAQARRTIGALIAKKTEIWRKNAKRSLTDNNL